MSFSIGYGQSRPQCALSQRTSAGLRVVVSKRLGFEAQAEDGFVFRREAVRLVVKHIYTGEPVKHSPPASVAVNQPATQL